MFSCPKDKEELGFESTLLDLEMSNEIEVEEDQKLKKINYDTKVLSSRPRINAAKV